MITVWCTPQSQYKPIDNVLLLFIPCSLFHKKVTYIFVKRVLQRCLLIEWEDGGFSACCGSRHPDFSLWEISAADSLWLVEGGWGSLAYSTGPKWWVIALNKFFANWYLLSHKSQCQPFRIFTLLNYEYRRKELIL